MLRENCTNERRKADLRRLNQSTEVDFVHFVAVTSSRRIADMRILPKGHAVAD